MVASAVAIVLATSSSSLKAKSQPAHAAVDIGDINVNDGFAELVKAVKPAVVNISVTGHTTMRSKGSQHGFQGQSPELEEFFKRFFGETPSLPHNQN